MLPEPKSLLKFKDTGNHNPETKNKKDRKAFRREVEEKRGQLPTTGQVRSTSTVYCSHNLDC